MDTQVHGWNTQHTASQPWWTNKLFLFLIQNLNIFIQQIAFLSSSYIAYARKSGL